MSGRLRRNPQLPGDEPVLLTIVTLPTGVLLTRIEVRAPEGFSLQLVQPTAPHRESRQKQKLRLPSACDDRTVTDDGHGQTFRHQQGALHFGHRSG